MWFISINELSLTSFFAYHSNLGLHDSIVSAPFPNHFILLDNLLPLLIENCLEWVLILHR